MPNRLRIALLAVVVLAVALWAVAAKQPEGPVCPPPQPGAAEAPAPERQRIALMPIELPREVAPAAAHCPICGVALQVGEIRPGAEERLTDLIQSWLVANRCFDVIDPGTAEGAYQNLLRQTMTGTTVGYMRGVGRELGAEAVLGGTLYRYRERVGTAYSVQDAASIGFDLHLIRTSDGAILWSNHFDETQKNLTENIFNIFTFFKRGVRWLTVDEFAAQVVGEAMGSFPRQVEAPAD